MCLLKIFLSAIIAVFAVTRVRAADYPSHTIADSLKKNANVVKRYEEIRVEIVAPDKAKIYTRYANTILNEAGDEYAAYVSGYDKFNSINYISGTLYNAEGQDVKHVKTRDCKDESAFDGISLMDDDRLKKTNFYCRNYPYTVEYEEEDEKKGIFSLSYWMPQENQYISVEYSKLTVVTPAGYALRYKQNNYAGKPLVTEASGKKIYTWEVRNLPAKIKEPYAPAWNEVVTCVSLAPSDFKIGGYEGNMDSWKNFGVFINNLLQGRNILPDGMKQKIHELTDNIKQPEEKINLLYHLLQQNTRYISVQLGIGGWQPFDANYVYTNKYGDCKALSNYMVAMLREAGIKAYYVLISAMPYAQNMVADFPSNQFNHATVCVPLQHDTMWLECTDQTMPTGYISNFTGNRQAILIDENGGHIVSTTRYTSDDNMQVRNLDAVIDGDGKLAVTVHAFYKCLEQDDIHDLINNKTKKEQLDELKKEFDLPMYDVVSFDYAEQPSAKPVINETLQLTADNFASVSGKRMFITPDILTRNPYKLVADSDRKYDVYLRYGVTQIDTIHIKIPAGYVVEAKPKEVTIKKEFGDYNIRYSASDNEIVCYRYFKKNDGRFPATSYNTLVTFYNDIYKADRSRFVLLKKDS